jgi:hypothetical protein
MTTLQRELKMKLPELDCSGQYDEQTGHLNILYEGAMLCSLHGDGLVAHRHEYHIGNNRSNKYYAVSRECDMIDEYLNAYETAPQIEAEGGSDYRKLAEHNQIVLAAKDCENHGFMFTTWRQSADRKSLNGGDYSRSYDYSKESFAIRSGLINKNRVFIDEEAENLYRCLSFANEHCEELSFDREQELKELLTKLEYGYPQIEENPPSFDENENLQFNM